MTPLIQPGTIVAAVDGSSHAERAVRWAADQAYLERRPLVVVSVTKNVTSDAASWAIGPYLIEDLLEETQKVADDAAELARDQRPGLFVHAAGIHGHPQHVLVELASTAGMLVLGSRGRGPVRTAVLGSVSAYVAEHAECPVVVCRPTEDGGPRAGVVVGIPGSPGSDPVIEFAFRQASLRSQPLTVVHSYGDLEGVTWTNLLADSASNLQESRLVLAESIAGFGEKFPEVEVNLRPARGLPQEVLATVGEKADLVVVGRRQIGLFTRIVGGGSIGSTTGSVVRRSRTTVAIVPEASPEDDGR